MFTYCIIFALLSHMNAMVPKDDHTFKKHGVLTFLDLDRTVHGKSD